MVKKEKSYKALLDEIARFEFHELMEQHSLKELKSFRKKVDKQRAMLINALKEKEKKGEL